MVVLWTSEYVQIAIELASELVLREHALDSLLYESVRLSVVELLSCQCALTPRKTCVARVDFVCPLLACEVDLLGIDHDDVVTTIGMRGEVGLVLSSDEACHFTGHATECLSFCIDEQPLLVCSLFGAGDGLVTQCIHYRNALI